jgi:hypothetical protein
VKGCQNRGGGDSLVVGEDIRVDQILDLVGKTLVGNFLGRWVGMDQIQRWVNEVWFLVLGYGPNFHLLSRGWLGFIFHFGGGQMQL